MVMKVAGECCGSWKRSLICSAGFCRSSVPDEHDAKPDPDSCCRNAFSQPPTGAAFQIALKPLEPVCGNVIRSATADEAGAYIQPEEKLPDVTCHMAAGGFPE